MDKLVEFLTSKIGYTIAIILGFIVPGAMFIFVWNSKIYMDMNIASLLLLAFGISFLMAVPNLFIVQMVVAIIEKMRKISVDFLISVFASVVLAVLEIIYGILCKIDNESITIKQFVSQLRDFLYLPFCVLTVIYVLACFWCWMKGKLRKK